MAPDVVDRFLECAAGRPEHAAVIGSGRAVTYRDLAMRVRRFAAAFARTPAPKILIALPQCADAYAAMFAAGLAGGFYSPVNTQAPVEKLVRIVRQLQPDIIIGAPALACALIEAAPGADLAESRRRCRSCRCSKGRGTRHRLAYVIFHVRLDRRAERRNDFARGAGAFCGLGGGRRVCATGGSGFPSIRISRST